MFLDLDPAALLTSALIAVMMSIPISFVLAGAAISGRRSTWNNAGLVMGLGLLLGVILAGARLFVLSRDGFAVLADVLMLVGLVGALVAAVLVIVLQEGTGYSAVLGAAACGVIGFSEPNQIIRDLAGITTSPLVITTSMVIEVVALVAIVGFLVAVAGRVRAMQIGVAAAGIVTAALLILGGLSSLAHQLLTVDVPFVPLSATLIVSLVAFVVGSVTGGVLDVVRSRRESAADAG